MCIDFKMFIDVEVLDEVVVIGYGIKKKCDVIGFVAIVKLEDIIKLKIILFVDGLQGQVLGVQVVFNSGVLGVFFIVKIWGISLIFIDIDLLWIVDGMFIYIGFFLGASNGVIVQDLMSMINFNDIEFIQVLKDVAVMAIYGFWGFNGVIIIIIKLGKKGQGFIIVDYLVGFMEFF